MRVRLLTSLLAIPVVPAFATLPLASNCFAQTISTQPADAAPSILASPNKSPKALSISSPAPNAPKASANRPVALLTGAGQRASSRTSAPVTSAQGRFTPGSRVAQVVCLEPPAPDDQSPQLSANLPVIDTGGYPLLPMTTAHSSPSGNVMLAPLVPAASAPRTGVSEPSTEPFNGAPVTLQSMTKSTGNVPSVVANMPPAGLPFEVLPITKVSVTDSGMKAKGNLTTESMIGPLSDPQSLFARLHTQPSPPAALAAPVRTHSDQVPWATESYTWYTPVFSHHPVYFEQPNLERYGMGTYRVLQPAASSAHFFSSIALLPYKALTQHPCERVYTLGYDRPGNCAAYQGRPWLGQSSIGEVFKVWNPYSGY